MNIPWPRLRTATIPIVLALLFALLAAAPGTSRAAVDPQGVGVEADPLPPVSCPCALWTSSDEPVSGADQDTVATEVGVKFRVDRPGFLVGIRFWKVYPNTGRHTGTLWSETGQRLASVQFTDESETGWQQANFTALPALAANTTYVVSYQASNGGYSADQGGLTTAHSRGPLTAPASADIGGNGVYAYGTGFPNSTWNDTNYWVTPVFNTTNDSGPAPEIFEQSPKPGEVSVPVDTNLSAAFDREVRYSTIRWHLFKGEAGDISGATSYDGASRTVRFNPTADLAAGYVYQVRLSADSIDGTPMPTKSWYFTTAGGPQ
ncbi:DUF4082 domain-containing protein [Embleya hyalina]|uniref:DUF4082 domain-containing protein n=1 Tax=Embleya hyalina TaxID=516124 RepID=A0A401YTA6_9ACTN|nr:DUF4082 domain-containing protein [Embleya hyalina]GCD97809.1 hypothetical protein EHYA_05505 [Embleya hyalina]